MAFRETLTLPLVKIAAVAVIVLSAVGIGVLTGVIPFSEGTPAGVRLAAAKCPDCGVVESIRTVEVKGRGTGLGAVAGGVVGVIVGSEIGRGDGRTLAQIAGGAGGAYAGNEIEKNARKTIQYEVVLRLRDGTLRTVMQASVNGLSAGDRAKIVNGSVVRG